jgi:hypothetical protein
MAAEQLAYALDVMEARGDLDPDSPLAQQFVQDYVKDTVMHEVGPHAGPAPQLPRLARLHRSAAGRPEFTRANGTTGSVMEYNAVNLPRPGERAACRSRPRWAPTTTGPSNTPTSPAAGSTPQDEQAELQAHRRAQQRAAAGLRHRRGRRPGHRPRDDELTWAPTRWPSPAKRLAIARDLFRRQETRELPPERDYAVLRRSLNYALATWRAGGRAGAPDRRRAHAARLSRQRARPAAARAGRCAAPGAST